MKSIYIYIYIIYTGEELDGCSGGQGRSHPLLLYIIYIYIYAHVCSHIQEESLTVAQGDKGALILRFAPIDAPREETLLIKLKVLTLPPSLPPFLTLSRGSFSLSLYVTRHLFLFFFFYASSSATTQLFDCACERDRQTEKERERARNACASLSREREREREKERERERAGAREGERDAQALPLNSALLEP